MKHSREAVAYHEAGHAVAALVLGLKIGRRGVTIVPDKRKGILGTAHILNQLREDPGCSIGPRTHLWLERLAVMCFAGDAAECKAKRKANGRRRFGAHQHYDQAAGVLECISTSPEQYKHRVEVAYFRARTLVDTHWALVQAVAEGLLVSRTLSRDDILAISSWNAVKLESGRRRGGKAQNG
jgi:hypothetical protein